MSSNNINDLPFELIANIVTLSNQTPATNLTISLTSKSFLAAIKYNALTQSQPRARYNAAIVPDAPSRFRRNPKSLF